MTYKSFHATTSIAGFCLDIRTKTSAHGKKPGISNGFRVKSSQLTQA